MKKIFFLLLFIASFHFIQAQNMSNKKLDKLLIGLVDSLDRDFGKWQFYYKGVKMVLLTDDFHNRMRIISPIIYVNDLKPDYFKKSLEANFHSSLDCKYAISDEIMWTVFIHPLKELSEAQFIDALDQLNSSAKTFGTSYSSGNLHFIKK